MPAYYLDIAVLVLGLVLLMVEAFAEKLDKRVLGYTAIAGLGAILAALCYVPATGTEIWGFYRVDHLALFYKGLALVTTIIVLVMALEYRGVLAHYGTPLGEFLCLPLFACAGLMWMASMNDLIAIFVSLEAVTVTFYVLVSFMRRNVGSLEAGTKYLILGAVSTGILVYGISWLFGLTGQTHLSAIKGVLAHYPGATGPLLFAMALMLVGMSFKVAAVPFQMWVPDVYQGAPTPVTAFLSVGSKAAGFIVLIRLLGVFIPSVVGASVLTTLGIIAGATLLVGNLAAIGQGNFKRLLAYSSISHAGFLILALALKPALGDLNPVLIVSFYLGTYLVMTLLCFLVLVIVRAAQPAAEGSEDLSAFDGLGKRSPLLAFALTIGVASLAGVPLTAGFWGKFFIFRLAVGAHSWWLVGLAIVGAASGFYYYFKVIRSMYWNEPAAGASVPVVSNLARVTLFILLAAVLLFGIFPGQLLAWVG